MYLGLHYLHHPRAEGAEASGFSMVPLKSVLSVDLGDGLGEGNTDT